jgi:hypothetical protein
MPRNFGAFLFYILDRENMKKITLLLLFISAQFVLGQAPNWNWVKKSTGAINEGFACVTTDSNGNVFAGGSIISETADFGLGTVTTNGYADYVIIKYDPSGTPQWMKNGGGTGNEVVYNMTTDASGNLYALVSFQSATMTFGNYTLTNTGTVPGAGGLFTLDMALVKYDTNGTVLWAKKIGGSEDEISPTVSCDAFGNVYITTRCNSQSLTVGNISVSTITNSLIGSVLAKIDSQGTTLWIKRFGNDTPFEPTTLSPPIFDASGNCYLTGGFSSETFTLGTVTYTNATPGLTDAFIVKLDPNGTILQQKALQGSDEDALGAIVKIQNQLFVPFGISLLPSSSSATYSYDGLNYTTPTTASGLMKVDENLQFNSFLYTPDISGRIVTDGTSIFLAGTFYTPTETFGTTTLTNTNSSTVLQTYEIFVAKMNTNGQFLWAKSAGGMGNDDLLGLAIDPSGNLFLAGYFDSLSCSFGNTTITNSSQATYVDAYLAKLNSTSLGNSNFEKDALVLYPNPTNNYVTINTKNAVKRITISDLNGRILDTQFDTIVNLTQLISGIYFLNIETEMGISSHKIIKQ